ncbi:hypothetical protein GVAV_001543 [Gurleya vavrai]
MLLKNKNVLNTKPTPPTVRVSAYGLTLPLSPHPVDPSFDNNMATPQIYSNHPSKIIIKNIETSKILNAPTTPPNSFKGDPNESIGDWIRQFDNYIILYESFNEKNLNFYASGYLQANAGTFYDNLCPKPGTWSELKKILKVRYGKPEPDKAMLYRMILNTEQQENESSIEFCNKIYRLGEKAGMDEKLIVETAINNMIDISNRILYRLNMKELTFNELIKIVKVIELEKIDHKYEQNHLHLKMNRKI